MASVNIILRLSKPKKDGTFPLYLQVIKNRKPSEMSLKISLTDDEWDSSKQVVKRKNTRYKSLNSQIRNIKLQIDEIVHKFEMSDQAYVGHDIIKSYKYPLKSESLDTHLCKFLTAHVSSNPENLQINSLKAYSNLISCLSIYAPNLLFSELNDDFLFAYEKYLQSLGKATNTISGRMKIIRKSITLAINKGILNGNPIKRYKRTNEESKRDFLTLEELRIFEYCIPKTEISLKVKDMFLFMCYTGLRFSDICTLTKSDVFIDDHSIFLHLRMNKSNSLLNIKLNSKATYIYLKYKSLDSIYLFCIINEKRNLSIDQEVKRGISNRNAYFNKTIKNIAKTLKINKNISMHIARHTFATISLSLGIDIMTVSKLLGHKNVRETQIYAKVLDDSKVKAIDLWDNI